MTRKKDRKKSDQTGDPAQHFYVRVDGRDSCAHGRVRGLHETLFVSSDLLPFLHSGAVIAVILNRLESLRQLTVKVLNAERSKLTTVSVFKARQKARSTNKSPFPLSYVHPWFLCPGAMAGKNACIHFPAVPFFAGSINVTDIPVGSGTKKRWKDSGATKFNLLTSFALLASILIRKWGTCCSTNSYSYRIRCLSNDQWREFRGSIELI